MLLVATAAVFIASWNLLATKYDPNGFRYQAGTASVVAGDVPLGSADYSLANGQNVTVSPEQWLSDGTAKQGDLLLIGSRPSTWAYTVPPSQTFLTITGGCYEVIAYGAWITGGALDVLLPQITKSSGDPSKVYFRFPLAATFDAHLDTNGNPVGHGFLCLSASGEATAYH